MGQRSRTHETYHNMVERCRNPRRPDFQHYGGRGIKVCSRWTPHPAPNGTGYRAFLADMGERPQGQELDRIDNDGDYSPENCRWVTRATNIQNSKAAKLSWEDVRWIRSRPGLTQRAMAEKFGVTREQISNIVRGISWKTDTRDR